MSIDHYEVQGTIYVRDGLKVKKAKNRLTGANCLLKLVRRSRLDSDRLFRHYADLLVSEYEHQSLLSPEYVWPARQISREGQYTCKHGKTCLAAYIELDWCEKGTFFGLQAAFQKPLDEVIARTFFHQLVEAVAYCHQQRVIHWNLMSESLLLDDNFRLRLADFRGPEKMHRKDAETPPEALYGEVQSGAAVDMFCLGYVLFSWVFFEPPFSRAERTNLHYSKLIEDNQKFWSRGHKDSNVSASLKGLLASMLAFDPTQRPTISEIKSHPWYQDKLLSSKDLLTTVESCFQVAQLKQTKSIPKANRFAIASSNLYRDLPDSSCSWSGSEGSISSSAALLPTYSSSGWKFSQLFISHSPELLWSNAVSLLRSQFYVVDFQTQFFKLKAEHVTDTSKIAFSMRLLDCGEGKYCLDFTQEAGLSFDFLQFFSDFARLAEEALQG